MRIAEGMTQKKFAEETGISLGTIKNYETGQNTVGLKTVEQILRSAYFEKYTLWLMTGKTSEVAGQIAPVLMEKVNSKKTG